MNSKENENLNKKAQIVLPLGRILLDDQNPRLADEYHKRPQNEILGVLYKEFDLEEVAFSMVENGYFAEEPIVIVPKNLPKGFRWASDVDKLQSDLNKVIKEDKSIEFIVVEGNRRISAAKLLTDQSLRSKLKIKSSFPFASKKKVFEDLLSIPAIVYRRREEVSPYLGVRHIAGNLKWESYAKARYIAAQIEQEVKSGKSIESSISQIKRKVGDRADTIKKQYMYYKIFNQIKDETVINANEIINRFSLIAEAINAPSIREYIGIPSYKEVNFKRPIVAKNNLKKLESVFVWIFGDGENRRPLLTDSRMIRSRLAHVLSDSEATEYLIKYENLEEAYERSGGDEFFLKTKINHAKRNIQSALQVGYKFKKDKEIIDLVDELKTAIETLQDMVKGND